MNDQLFPIPFLRDLGGAYPAGLFFTGFFINAATLIEKTAGRQITSGFDVKLADFKFGHLAHFKAALPIRLVITARGKLQFSDGIKCSDIVCITAYDLLNILADNGLFPVFQLLLNFSFGVHIFLLFYKAQHVGLIN